MFVYFHFYTLPSRLHITWPKCSLISSSLHSRLRGRVSQRTRGRGHEFLRNCGDMLATLEANVGTIANSPIPTIYFTFLRIITATFLDPDFFNFYNFKLLRKSIKITKRIISVIRAFEPWFLWLWCIFIGLTMVCVR